MQNPILTALTLSLQPNDPQEVKEKCLKLFPGNNDKPDCCGCSTLDNPKIIENVDQLAPFCLECIDKFQFARIQKTKNVNRQQAPNGTLQILKSSVGGDVNIKSDRIFKASITNVSGKPQLAIGPCNTINFKIDITCETGFLKVMTTVNTDLSERNAVLSNGIYDLHWKALTRCCPNALNGSCLSKLDTEPENYKDIIDIKYGGEIDIDANRPTMQFGKYCRSCKKNDKINENFTVSYTSATYDKYKAPKPIQPERKDFSNIWKKAPAQNEDLMFKIKQLEKLVSDQKTTINYLGSQLYAIKK
jgi:hypothetical protein